MNLNDNIDLNLKHFFRWWGRELAYWIPEKIRQTLSDKSGYVYLRVKDDLLIFHAGEQEIARFDLATDGQEKWEQLLTDNPELAKSHFVLTLQAGQALAKEIFLPLAAKENLQQVILFELDKLTPFQADQIYFSVKQLGKEENGQIRVLIVFTPKDKLDGLLSLMQSAQFYPDYVEYVAAPNDYLNELEPYNLLPEQQRPNQSKASRYLTWGLSFLLLLIVTTIMVFPLWHESRLIDDLEAQLGKIKKDTHLVQSRQLEIDDVVELTEMLIRHKQDEPSILVLLSALTELIPDDTWLTSFKYKDHKLQIQGQSPSATALISVLEDYPLFSDTRFVSPLTQDKKTGLERFQISVKVAGPGAIRDE